MRWMLLPFWRYADFSGRSRRREYWMFALLNAIVFSLLFGLAMAAGLRLSALQDLSVAAGLFGRGVLMVTGLLFLLWWLAVFIPSLAVTVRRLHDRDKSGWWYLGFMIASFIPLVNIIAGIALLVVLLQPGTPGPNRYGRDPRDPSRGIMFA